MTAAAPQKPATSNSEPPRSSRHEIDQALAALTEHKAGWANLPVADRRAILRELLKDFTTVGKRWAEAVRKAEGIPPGTPTAGEEWLAGPYFILRNIRLLELALADIEQHGQPQIPGPVRSRPDGQVTAQVFPQQIWDKLFYGGIRAEVWMEPGVTAESLPSTQAVSYQQPNTGGQTCLVLGGGNVSSIGPMDALYKLFVDNTVVLLKMHPLNAYLGPLLGEGFQALIDWGALRIVYGGAEEGAYCCEHPQIEEIHITGSDKTVEAIVFGPGEEGARRKAERRPKLTKPVFSELGNVSPVIVVPGPWSAGDLEYHGENIAGSLANNAGFNCNASRVIITHEGWAERSALLDQVRQSLSRVPTRKAYYPGADERFERFVEAHPEAERLGQPDAGELPWTLIPNLDPAAEDEICFTTEAFCSVFGETALPADSVGEFLDRAVQFCNETLWGTLNVTLLVHPKTLADPAAAAALDRALAGLRYGAVSVNNWAAICYGLVVTPWGAHPGSDIYDIQSGTGVVHNTLMFSRPQKTVIHSPFRMSPKPVWFPSHKTALEMGQKLCAFESDPSLLKLPGIFYSALRG